MNFRKFPRCILELSFKELTEVMNWLGSSLLDEVIDKTFAKIRFWSVVVRGKFIFNIAHETVGAAGSHFGSYCKTVVCS